MLPYIIANSNPAGHGLLPGLTTGDLGAWAASVSMFKSGVVPNTYCT